MSHDQDLSQYSMLDLFRMEADGQARALTGGLLSLERGAPDAATLEGLMRAAHSIKGAAAIVGLDVVVQLAHAMEDAFVAAQRGALQLTAERVDVLLAAVDLITQLSTIPEAQVAAWLGEHAVTVDALLASVRGIGALMAPPSAPPVVVAPTVSAPPEAPAQNFDQLLALASESRINAHQMRPFIESLQRIKRQQASLFQAIDQLHESLAQAQAPSLLEQSTLAQQKTTPLKQLLHAHMADLEAYERRLLGVSKNLVDEVLALRMCPFSEGVHSFPRMVRDLARSLGKEARLTIVGENTPVDREILAHIESPLSHMLRNAVDHGIESPAERAQASKPVLGEIRLEARHRNGMLDIEISDDGRGVDVERIRARVVARQMASDAMAQAMSKAELLEFLFLPAFSMKDTANAVSGRGVGLDLVLRAIRDQNGSVHIDTEPGAGFRTSITLPLTQSIVRALVVDVAGEAYAIPIVKVERVMMADAADLRVLEGKQYVEANGEHLGLVAASQVLELGPADVPEGAMPLVVIGGAGRRYALVVDAVRGELSLAVQALDPMFGKMRDIASASLLDDGAPVLILDVPDLLLSIDKLLHEGTLQQLGRHGAHAGARARRILVVDDSLTVREMERKLLAGRGYLVDVAVDGIDGWNAVRANDYDLLITDVDMPRMDGIELVSLVRKDARLHKLPAMIVSYKDRAEDRARGMAAGADYYLTKGSFHDETLLEAVHDLIGEAAP